MPSIFQGIVQNIRCTRKQLGPQRVLTDWDKRGTFSILFGQSMFEAFSFDKQRFIALLLHIDSILFQVYYKNSL